jgi:hypothetical protein
MYSNVQQCAATYSNVQEDKYAFMIISRSVILRMKNVLETNGIDTKGEKEKRTPKENVDGRSRSSHDSKKFRTRSMEKEREMAFGLQKTATAVKNTGRTDRQMDGWTDGRTDRQTHRRIDRQTDGRTDRTDGHRYTGR